MVQNLLSQFRGDGLRGRALRGSALTFVQFGVSNALRLGSNLILTRLLFPEAFGLMALVMVVMTGLAMFSDLGFRPAIIQSPRGDDPVYLDTAWTLQIARGIILWLFACALATPVATFYDAPMLAQLLPVAGLAAIVEGFNSTRLATANRHMMLSRVVAATISAQFVGIVIMIALAWATKSIWAIVIGNLAGSFTLMTLSHLILPGHPNRFRFERPAFAQLFSFGKYIFLSTVAGFLITQGDRAVLGKHVALADLALYNIAFFLASVPSLLSGAMVDRIIFPLYANRPPSKSAENRQQIAKARFMTTGALLAIGTVIAVSGDFLIGFLYDPRYHGAGPILVLLSLSFMPGLIVASYNGLPLAAGHSGRFAVLVTMQAVVQVLLVLYAALHYGLRGVVFVPFLSTLVIYPLMVSLVRRYGGWDPRHDAVYIAVVSLVMAATVWANWSAITVFLSGSSFVFNELSAHP
jgi:O-antigen/teichoic acid export membrane protein